MRCWLPPESDSTVLDGRALDVEVADAFRGQLGCRAPVDEEAPASFGEDEVLGQLRPGNEALLQPGGRQVGDAVPLEEVVGLARHVARRQEDPARHGPVQSGAGRQEASTAPSLPCPPGR